MAELNLTHNGNTKWSRTFTAAEVKVFQHFYEQPIDQFTNWLERVVDKEIKRMKREMSLDGYNGGMIDQEAAITSMVANPAYKDAAQKAAERDAAPEPST